MKKLLFGFLLSAGFVTMADAQIIGAKIATTPPTYSANTTQTLSGTTSGALRVQLNLGGSDLSLLNGTLPVTISSNAVPSPSANTGTSSTTAVPVQGTDGNPLASAANQTNGNQKTQVTSEVQIGATGNSTNVTMSSTAGTFITAATANTSRVGCLLKYKAQGTGVVSVFIGTGTATVAASLDLVPGQSYTCGEYAVERNAIQVSSTVASDPNIVLVLQ